MASKRRGNKEGSYQQRSNGTWRVQLYHQGERLSFSAKTKKDCQLWVTETNNQFSLGSSIEGLTITTSSFLKKWLSNKKENVSEKVYNQYFQVTRDYINPNLGFLKLKEINSLRLINLYNKEIKNRRNQILGWRTKKLIHSILHQAFQDAIIWGFIIKNPTVGISPPKRNSKEIIVLSPSESSQLLSTAQILNDPQYPFIQTALTTGMRLSELQGLQWDDINWKTQTLHVQKQIRRIKGGGFEFANPKTSSGKRKIEIGYETIKLLKHLRGKQHTQMINARENWDHHNLIFTSNRGTPIHSTNVRRQFYKLLQRAGLPRIRFHDLRHTAASLMLNSGIPAMAVSKRLGHSSISVTLDTYGHYIPEMQKGIGNMIDEMISPLDVKLHQNCTGNSD